jgi:hypothetical protein
MMYAALLSGTADAFSATRLPSSVRAASNARVAMVPPQEEGTEETSTDYYSRLQEAARDPKKFEQFVMNDGNKEDEEPEAPVVEPKKGGYQRIEEWDAQRSRDDMSWEERVQFDGQRNGNQFQQNEILRRNLKAW